MQTATHVPAQVVSKSGHTAKPQTNTDTGAFSLDKTQATATKSTLAAGAPLPATCSKCQSTDSWGESAWCPMCGFYPKLGICIPVDAIKPMHVEEKIEAGEIPRWVWALGIGGVAILLVSIVARMQVPEDGPRTLWTLGQIALGVTLLLASHIQAYVISGFKSDKLGIFDMVAAPVAIWRAAIEALPRTGWLMTRCGWGLATVLCGFLVVGGLGWDEINSMIAAKAANQQKFKPLAAIASLSKGKGAARSGGTENVDDAMNKFVEELGVENLNAGGAAVVEESPGLRKQCAIVGFTKNVDGDLKSVLLATMSGGRPETFVAKVPVDKLPANISSRLASVLPDLRTQRPSVECPLNAYWVKPDLTCTMSFEEGAEEGTWSEVKFVEMLNAAGIDFNAEQTAEIIGETTKDLERSLPQLQDALGGN